MNKKEMKKIQRNKIGAISGKTMKGKDFPLPRPCLQPLLLKNKARSCCLFRLPRAVFHL